MLKSSFSSAIVLKRFNKYVVKDAAKARKIIRQADYKADAYLLRCIALTYKDEAVFNADGQMRKVVVQRKLKLAKKYIDNSFRLKPACRDILFTKGDIYNIIGETKMAIDCYISIMEQGEDLGQEANCSGSDLHYVRMILNDARFQLYRLFHDLESYELSMKFMKAYISHLKEGIDTIYKPLDKFLMDPSHAKYIEHLK